ncbi:PLP-dependent aminotransferase family protein [Gordonia jacobaea]|uniref:MocR-like pyridoxine biosynthesis transcription factor PdxR n=1 Tax=Gordonia jacobaea TaxID=122202 RepID=UPI0022E394DA|nr:aminotransferase class I/II-fold pyridoxal phosphate-dependent enzyme [Gordonia jacobaea]
MTGDRWSALAERLGTDLYLDLQPDPNAPTRGRSAQLRSRLADELRSAIADGRLTPGMRLPPYRSLAADLGLARGTVSSVYSELIAEGWLTARQGAGTSVATGFGSPGSAGLPPATVVSAPRVAHDFSLGQPNTSQFPRTAWIRSMRRAISTADDSAFGPTPPNGSERLRVALAGYLARARGVRAHPDQIVLTTSVLSALNLLARTLFRESVAAEAYGLPFFRDPFTRRGALVSPIPVDHDGADVTALANLAVTPQAVLLTPSHQSPIGVPLAPQRRAAAIEWARATDAFLIEDDYDGELRYDREPVGAMQALAPDHIIYTGSVSKSLSPSIRIGWLVLPPELVSTVMWAKGMRETDASIVDQLALADMIETGSYDKHIRSSRQFYRHRRQALIERLHAHKIATMGISAGLHAVLPVPVDVEASVLAATHERGFSLGGLDALRHPDAPRLHDARGEPTGGILVGFGTPPVSTFDADVTALIDLLEDHLPNRRLRAE